MISLSAGLLGLIVFIALWWTGHFVLGVILGVLIAAVGPAITIGGRRGSQ